MDEESKAHAIISACANHLEHAIGHGYKIDCPHCGGEFKLDAVTAISQSQKLAVRMQSEGGHISAELICGVIQNTNKLLEDIAIRAGVEIRVFITGMNVEPGGEASIEFTTAKLKRDDDMSALF